MGLQTDPDPNPQSLGTCSLTRQGEIKVAAGINTAQRLTLKQEVSLNYPSGTDIITRFLKNGRGNVTGKQRDGSVKTQPDTVGFEDGEREH